MAVQIILFLLLWVPLCCKGQGAEEFPDMGMELMWMCCKAPCPKAKLKPLSHLSLTKMKLNTEADQLILLKIVLKSV